MDEIERTPPLSLDSEEKSPSGANGVSVSYKICSTITQQDLKNLFHLPLKVAAATYSISDSHLKKICRKLGIQVWPGRKIMYRQRQIDTLQYTMSTGEHTAAEVAEMHQTIRRLYNEVAAIKENAVKPPGPAGEQANTSPARTHTLSSVDCAETGPETGAIQSQPAHTPTAQQQRPTDGSADSSAMGVTTTAAAGPPTDVLPAQLEVLPPLVNPSNISCGIKSKDIQKTGHATPTGTDGRRSSGIDCHDTTDSIHRISSGSTHNLLWTRDPLAPAQLDFGLGNTCVQELPVRKRQKWYRQLLNPPHTELVDVRRDELSADDADMKTHHLMSQVEFKAIPRKGHKRRVVSSTGNIAGNNLPDDALRESCDASGDGLDAIEERGDEELRKKQRLPRTIAQPFTGTYQTQSERVDDLLHDLDVIMGGQFGSISTSPSHVPVHGTDRDIDKASTSAERTTGGMLTEGGSGHGSDSGSGGGSGSGSNASGNTATSDAIRVMFSTPAKFSSARSLSPSTHHPRPLFLCRDDIYSTIPAVADNTATDDHSEVPAQQETGRPHPSAQIPCSAPQEQGITSPPSPSVYSDLSLMLPTDTPRHEEKTSPTARDRDTSRGETSLVSSFTPLFLPSVVDGDDVDSKQALMQNLYGGARVQDDTSIDASALALLQLRYHRDTHTENEGVVLFDDDEEDLAFSLRRNSGSNSAQGDITSLRERPCSAENDEGSEEDDGDSDSEGSMGRSEKWVSRCWDDMLLSSNSSSSENTPPASSDELASAATHAVIGSNTAAFIRRSVSPRVAMAHSGTSLGFASGSAASPVPSVGGESGSAGTGCAAPVTDGENAMGAVAVRDRWSVSLGKFETNTLTPCGSTVSADSSFSPSPKHSELQYASFPTTLREERETRSGIAYTIDDKDLACSTSYTRAALANKKRSGASYPLDGSWGWSRLYAPATVVLPPLRIPVVKSEKHHKVQLLEPLIHGIRSGHCHRQSTAAVRRSEGEENGWCSCCVCREAALSMPPVSLLERWSRSVGLPRLAAETTPMGAMEDVDWLHNTL